MLKKFIYKKASKEDLKPEYVQLQNGQVINKNLYKSVYKDMKKETRNMSKKEVGHYLERKA
jgi:hypothetical protein